MRRPLLPLLLLTALASLTLAPFSFAAVVVDTADLGSATEGIALGGDGNYWVAKSAAHQVQRVTPAGEPVGDPIALTGEPASVSSGPGATVWVSLPAQKQVIRIDTATLTATTVNTAGASTCQPFALADGGNGKLYVSYPANGAACTSGIGTIDPATNTADVPTSGFGDVFALSGANGKLYAASFDTDTVFRLGTGAGLPVEAGVDAPAGSGPNGITAAADGNVYVSLFSINKAGVMAANAADNSTLTAIEAPSGALTSPLGIADTPAGLVVAGSGSHNLLAFDTHNVGTPFALDAADQPRQVAATADGALVTDKIGTTLHRLIDAAPVPGAVTAGGVTETNAALSAPITSKGNDTTVSFDYGTTTAYGSTAAGTPVAKAAGTDASSGELSGLAAATTYHVRATATNSRGTVSGPDVTFTTSQSTAPHVTPPAKTCKVPKLKGLTVKKAKKKLKKAHCKAGKVTKVKTKKVKVGRVLSSSPKAGKKIKRTKKVALKVRKR